MFHNLHKTNVNMKNSKQKENCEVSLATEV